MFEELGANAETDFGKEVSEVGGRRGKGIDGERVELGGKEGGEGLAGRSLQHFEPGAAATAKSVIARSEVDFFLGCKDFGDPS